MLKYFIAIVLIALVSYGFVKAWPLLYGPTLSVISPTDNAPFPSGIVTVRGKSERAAAITLNGAALLHDQNSEFSSILSFPRGRSILTFVAVDRFGRTVTETRSIFVPFEN